MLSAGVRSRAQLFRLEAPPAVRWGSSGTRSPRVRDQLHVYVGLREPSLPSRQIAASSQPRTLICQEGHSRYRQSWELKELVM